MILELILTCEILLTPKLTPTIPKAGTTLEQTIDSFEKTRKGFGQSIRDYIHQEHISYISSQRIKTLEDARSLCELSNNFEPPTTKEIEMVIYYCDSIKRRMISIQDSNNKYNDAIAELTKNDSLETQTKPSCHQELWGYPEKGLEVIPCPDGNPGCCVIHYKTK